MGAIAALRSGVRMLVDHHELVAWYLRNKVRIAGLRAEQARDDGHAARPQGITLKPTFSCNLRCRMCSFVASGAVRANPRDSLPLAVWQSFVDDVAQWRPYLWFTGGEPTLYPDFLPLVKHIRERGMLVGLTTNGTTMARFAERFVQHPTNIMVVSIDGEGEVHNHVRGNPRAYERATEGVLRLQELKRTHGTAEPVVIVNCALTPDNFESAPEMVRVARRLGAEALNFQHLWQMTRNMVEAHNARWGRHHAVSYDDVGGMEPAPMDPERVAQVVRRIRREAGDLPVIFHPEITPTEMRVYYERPEAFVRRRPAACAWLNTDILPNGDVSPCFEVVCGNITDERFSEIWNGDLFRAHRRRLGVDGDFPICSRCCAYWRRD